MPSWEVRAGADSIAVSIQFNNRELPLAAWSPEVAVQYVFEAAIAHVAAAVFDDSLHRFSWVRGLTVDVDIVPNDVPPQFVFGLARVDWERYQRSTSSEAKVRLYWRMRITSGRKKFKFDPVEAADVE